MALDSWENSRISLRQLKKVLGLELFGMASLLLPGSLAKDGNGSGLGGLVLGTVLACYMVSVILCCERQMHSMHSDAFGESKVTDYYTYLKSMWGTVPSSVFYLCYGIICLMGGAYVLKFLGSLLCTVLLGQEDFMAVSVVLCLLAVYGASAGLEVRARIGELLYWLLIIPLFFLLLLCIRQMEPAEWFPIWKDHGMQEAGAAAASILAFLPVQLLLFLPPHVAPLFKKGREVYGAVAESGLILFAIQLVLLGIFGRRALAMEEYPLMVLLGMVKLPGGFIKRLDIVMVSIWFFALFTFGEALLSYTAVIFDRLGTFLRLKLFRKNTGREDEICLRGIAKWKYAVAGVVLFLTVHVMSGHAGLEEWLKWSFVRLALPYLALLPLLSCLLFWVLERLRKKGSFHPLVRRRGKRLLSLLFLFFFSIPLSGCSATELEDKNFPLAVTLEQTAEGCKSAYLFQNLSELSSGKIQGIKSQYGVGRTYFEARQDYENSHRIQLDTGHTKALIIQRDFMENKGQWDSFLETERSEHSFARNTFVYLTKEPMHKLEKLNQELDFPLGTYLEQMMENERQVQGESLVTLSVLLNEQRNQNRTLLVPVLGIREERPVITAYEVLQDFRTKGQVTPEQALYYYLFRGGLRQWNVMDGQEQVRLYGFRVRMDIINEKISGKEERKADGEGVVWEERKAERDDVPQEEREPEENGVCREMETENNVVIKISIQGKVQRISGEKDLEYLEQELETEVESACRSLNARLGVDLSDSFHLLAMKNASLYRQYMEMPERYRGVLDYDIKMVLQE